MTTEERKTSKIRRVLTRIWDFNMLPRSVGESNALQIEIKKKLERTVETVVSTSRSAEPVFREK